mgnify:CR=1 FL=1
MIEFLDRQKGYRKPKSSTVYPKAGFGILLAGVSSKRLSAIGELVNVLAQVSEGLEN